MPKGKAVVVVLIATLLVVLVVMLVTTRFATLVVEAVVEAMANAGGDALRCVRVKRGLKMDLRFPYGRSSVAKAGIINDHRNNQKPP